MFTDDDSLYVWERHALPDNWKEQVLHVVPAGPLGPVIASIQAIVRRHGDLAIIVWQVQELAVLACGRDRPRLRAAYEHPCARLVEVAGSSWPITTALAEHLRGDDHTMQLQKRFLACEGEWHALLRLVDGGWMPVRTDREHGGPDWLVTKGGVELPVEVKTKMPLGTTAGRLTRAFIGLAMLPRFAFLRDLDYTWYADDDLNDATALDFLQGFLEHAATIAKAGCGGEVQRTLLESSRGTLRLFVRAERSFRLEFSRVRDGTPHHRRVVFEATPAAVADHVFTGGGSARVSNGPEAELPAIGNAFSRLVRGKQMLRMSSETLLVLVWHMPFHAMSYEPERLDRFWKSWCDEHGVVRGALQPITPAGNDFAMVMTDAARELDLAAGA